ncbi:MerR family transcriptional regulator [Streptacidiphilus sp. MAP5-3]|uniref:MerR family transcriptional regulator n=1 Tax=unclassified Streptacidiphilus TaxID=2643834 RepID=UPI003514F204
MTVIDSTPVTPPPLLSCTAGGAAGPTRPRTDGQDRYTISQVAALTGLTAHTLRWYEQIGLLPDVQRSATGQRVFDRRDLERLAFIGKLRVTGMSVAAMVRFAELTRQGETTADERQEVLEQTRRDVVARIAELQDALVALDEKLACHVSAHGAKERAGTSS